MSLWDVQRNKETGQIVAIRPAGFKGWGTGDNVGRLEITTEELGLTYFEKDAVSLEKGGDGLSKTAKQLADSQSLAALVVEKPADVSGALTVAQLDAEIQKRGYKPISLAAAVEK